jgi:hypothetical protein
MAALPVPSRWNDRFFDACALRMAVAGDASTTIGATMVTTTTSAPRNNSCRTGIREHRPSTAARGNILLKPVPGYSHIRNGWSSGVFRAVVVRSPIVLSGRITGRPSRYFTLGAGERCPAHLLSGAAFHIVVIVLWSRHGLFLPSGIRGRCCRFMGSATVPPPDSRRVLIPELRTPVHSDAKDAEAMSIVTPVSWNAGRSTGYDRI